MSASAVSSVWVFMPNQSPSIRDQPLELVELLGPALLGTSHRLSGRHGLEVGLTDGEHRSPVAGFESHLDKRGEELTLLVVDGAAAHDQAVRTFDFVVLATHVVGELRLGGNEVRP